MPTVRVIGTFHYPFEINSMCLLRGYPWDGIEISAREEG